MLLWFRTPWQWTTHFQNFMLWFSSNIFLTVLQRRTVGNGFETVGKSLSYEDSGELKMLDFMWKEKEVWFWYERRVSGSAIDQTGEHSSEEDSWNPYTHQDRDYFWEIPTRNIFDRTDPKGWANRGWICKDSAWGRGPASGLWVYNRSKWFGDGWSQEMSWMWYWHENSKKPIEKTQAEWVWTKLKTQIICLPLPTEDRFEGLKAGYELRML